jgi:predicted phage terminase large subunit-like protein
VNPEQNLQFLLAAQRMLHIKRSQVNVLDFIRLMMPDTEDPDDVTKSRFLIAPHHRLLAEALQKVADGSLKRLCISLSPRHGKSEMFSRMFPAWFLGKNPRAQVIVAGASTDFAVSEFGRKIKQIMTSPMYAQVFPNASLDGGSASVENLVTTEGGNIKSIGKGAQIIGRGADCVVGSTLITTNLGMIPIKDLLFSSSSHKVLCYNEQTKATEFRSIKAIASRCATWIYRITTHSGRVLEVTGEHPIYNGETYIKADSLAAGDRLLLSLPVADHKTSGGLQKTRFERALGVLLHESLRLSSLQRETGEARETLSRGVRNSSIDKASEGDVLLAGVQGSPICETAGREEGPHVGEVWNSSMPSLRGDYRTETSNPQSEGVLESVCEQGTRRADVGERESGIHPRSRQNSVLLERDASRLGSPREENTSSRRGAMRSMRSKSARSTFGRAPHRFEPVQQRYYQPRDVVRPLSHFIARGGAFQTQEDFVSVVERVRQDCPVYNLQVEEHENFFANGILTHNCLICDDLVAGIDEANSPTERQKLWDWFTTDAMSRLMPGGRVVVIHQRWHNSDLIGRLVDPDCPEYDPRVAKLWTHIKLPAVIDSPKIAEALGIELKAQTDPDIVDQFGEKPIAALWQDRYPLAFLAEMKRPNARRFEALYQGRPRLDEGNFFKLEWLRPYRPEDLPKNLRKYLAVDFAISTKQTADKTCIVAAGVDDQGIVWILPNIFWERSNADGIVSGLLSAMKLHKPLMVWAEKGHISQSLGPVIRKRMIEENTFCAIVDRTPVRDKLTRAQAFNAMCAMGRVRFPVFAHWWRDAESEILRFPEGARDDLIDALAWLGSGLQQLVPASQLKPAQHSGTPKTGTLAWVKQSSASEERRKRSAFSQGF